MSFCQLLFNCISFIPYALHVQNLLKILKLKEVEFSK